MRRGLLNVPLLPLPRLCGGRHLHLAAAAHARRQVQRAAPEGELRGVHQVTSKCTSHQSITVGLNCVPTPPRTTFFPVAKPYLGGCL